MSPMTSSDERAVFRTPVIAWPTVALWIASLAIWAFSFVAGMTALVPLWSCTVASTLCAYWLFTPFHDATHGALGQSKRLNEFVGHSCAVVLMAPFAAWCYTHLEHHKHTNHPERDPDHYAGRGPAWLMPLRWLTNDAYFFLWMKKREGGTVFYLGLWVVAIALMCSGHTLAVLFCWIIPARITTGLVTLVFSYLPHRPHAVTAKENRYQATRIMLAPGLSALFVCHNYHLIHHLYPGVPFYRYATIYALKRAELATRDAAIWTPFRR